VSALVIADSTIRRPVLVALPRLHFYDDQRAAIPSDEIGLAIARRQAIVTGNNDVTLPPQKAMRQILAAATESERRSPAPPPREVPESIREIA
jgi:hypothetical protein